MISSAVLLASTALASAQNLAGYSIPPSPNNVQCTTANYSISVSSQNTKFKNVTPNPNATSLVQTELDFLTAPMGSRNFSDVYEVGKQMVSGTYRMSGTLCKPKKAGKVSSSTVQLLVHGIGFDSGYWNFGGDISSSYPYVYHAGEAGYTTFRYDRLGTGLSEHPGDTFNTVQAATDVAIATKIISLLRSGKIGDTTFKKVIGVGHSYGSAQLQAVTAESPNALDAVVLTGYSTNATAMPVFAAAAGFSPATKVFPSRFVKGSLPATYLVTATIGANQFDFFHAPYFLDAALQLARKTEQPVTPGVLFTFGGLTATANDFTGPVHVVTGAKDLPFCFANCFALPPSSSLPNIPAGVKKLYPSASSFSTYIPANTGHNLASHVSAPEVGEEVNGWLLKTIT